MTDLAIVRRLLEREPDLTADELAQVTAWHGIVEKGGLLTHRERQKAEAMLARVTR